MFPLATVIVAQYLSSVEDQLGALFGGPDEAFFDHAEVPYQRDNAVRSTTRGIVFTLNARMLQHCKLV